MEIITVQTPKDLKAFIEFPYQLYKNDPVWVAPLRSEQAAQFVPEKNPMLAHCTYTLFLAKEGQRVVGRISAFIDHLAMLVGTFSSINFILPITSSTAVSRATISSEPKIPASGKMEGPVKPKQSQTGVI